jgi:hypothetical protein
VIDINRYKLENLITNNGFIKFSEATLIIDSNEKWSIYVNDKGDCQLYDCNLELVIETEEGTSFVSKGRLTENKIEGLEALIPLNKKMSVGS